VALQRHPRKEPLLLCLRAEQQVVRHEKRHRGDGQRRGAAARAQRRQRRVVHARRAARRDAVEAQQLAQRKELADSLAQNLGGLANSPYALCSLTAGEGLL
jgi:hypothetical protein